MWLALSCSPKFFLNQGVQPTDLSEEVHGIYAEVRLYFYDAGLSLQIELVNARRSVTNLQGGLKIKQIIRNLSYSPKLFGKPRTSQVQPTDLSEQGYMVCAWSLDMLRVRLYFYIAGWSLPIE